MLGFWLYMLAVDLLIPATMIGFGLLFLKRPPKRSTPFLATAACVPCKTRIPGASHISIAERFGVRQV